jgi:ATP-dependent Clp protease ATP-binding subunit ClpB
MQLEMEKQALKKERDAASKERLAKLEKELADLKEQSSRLKAQWQKEKEEISKSQKIAEQIEQLRTELEQAQRRGDLQRASEIQYGKIQGSRSARRFERKKPRWPYPPQRRSHRGGYRQDRVQLTGIPVSSLQRESARSWLRGGRLMERVVGREQAIRCSGAVRRARAGLQDENRPIGSFMFLGPTGVA